MRRLSSLVGILALLGAATAAGAEQDAGAAGVVRLKEQGTTVEVTIDGELFTTYHFGTDLPKPYFAPVRAPGGAVLTRPVEPGIKEHPHHRGIWLAVDEVNGIKFWAERGKIRNESITFVEPEGAPARMDVVNKWLGDDDEAVLTERTVIAIHPNRVVSYDITFEGGDEPVTFADTKEGLFGFRLADPLREKETGRVVTSTGVKGTRDAWGKTFAWIDYHGTLDGKTYGVAIFDHPDNFRPSRYHVRDYGLFSISPFGESSYTNGAEPANEKELRPGEKLRLRYAAYVHAGDAEEADVATAYQKWVEATKSAAEGR